MGHPPGLLPAGPAGHGLGRFEPHGRHLGSGRAVLHHRVRPQHPRGLGRADRRGFFGQQQHRQLRPLPARLLRQRLPVRQVRAIRGTAVRVPRAGGHFELRRHEHARHLVLGTRGGWREAERRRAEAQDRGAERITKTGPESATQVDV